MALIIPFTILNGGLREKIITPLLGNNITLLLNAITLSIFIFIVTIHISSKT